MKSAKFLAIFFFSAISVSAHSGSLELAAECVRADSGDYPEVKIYTDSTARKGMIVLSVGERAENIFTSTTEVTIRGSYQEHRGDISSEYIPTEGEGENFDQDVKMSFSSANKELISWLTKQTNLTNSGDLSSVSFKCRN